MGLGIGLSRLNASATLPDRGTTRFRATTFGGGLHVPLDDHLAIFVEGRMTVGADANELLAVAPISAGFSWRF